MTASRKSHSGTIPLIPQRVSILGVTVDDVTEDEAVRVNDCGWTEVLTVCPEHRARAGAGSTQDALGGVIETGAVFWALQALFGWLVVGNQERLNIAVGLIERFHVDDQIFFNFESLDWLNVNWLGDVEVFDQGLASKTVATIDAHGV